MNERLDESEPTGPDRRPLIELRSVERVFRAGELETVALAGVSLAIMPGEWLAVTGPSGSGKSTLLATLGLLERPSGGRCLFDGVDVTGWSDGQRTRFRRGRVAFVFQSIHLAARLSVAENIGLALRGLGLSGAECAERIAASLEAVDLAGRRSHRPAELSGGQQQRVAIARALAVRPRLLLADEPTGNLDSNTGARILELLARLHEGGTTVVLVTHEARIAAAAPRAIEMLDGRIVAERNDVVGR